MMVQSNHYQAVGELLIRYFDGIYHADTRKLAQVFHPDARYLNLTADEYVNLAVKDYLAIVQERPSPESLDTKRCERIIAIELANSELGFTKASMSMFNRDYVDFLTLTRHHEQWKIICKSFIYTTTKGKEYALHQH